MRCTRDNVAAPLQAALQVIAVSLLGLAGGCVDDSESPAPPTAPMQGDAGGELGLHNVLEITPGVFSGSAPADGNDFDALARRGIRTVISVDGAAPDVEAARRHGMRSIHLPLGYDEITTADRVRLAQAVAHFPHPVYVHCHHGVHRGPAATAVAMVTLGEISDEEGLRFLELAGTDPRYTGLFEAVRNAEPDEAARGAIDPDSFPEVATVSDLTEAMVRIDVADKHLRAIARAGWRVPHDQPDLVPLAEAGMLADALRDAAALPEVAAHPRLREEMEAATALARDLESALDAITPPAILDARLQAVRASCTACHRAHRDGPS